MRSYGILECHHTLDICCLPTKNSGRCTFQRPIWHLFAAHLSCLSITARIRVKEDNTNFILFSSCSRSDQDRQRVITSLNLLAHSTPWCLLMLPTVFLSDSKAKVHHKCINISKRDCINPHFITLALEAVIWKGNSAQGFWFQDGWLHTNNIQPFLRRAICKWWCWLHVSPTFASLLPVPGLKTWLTSPFPRQVLWPLSGPGEVAWCNLAQKGMAASLLTF